MRLIRTAWILLLLLLVATPSWAQFKDSSIPLPKNDTTKTKTQKRNKTISKTKKNDNTSPILKAKPKTKISSFKDPNLINPKAANSYSAADKIPVQPDLSLKTDFVSPIGLDLNILEIDPKFNQFLQPLLPMRVRVFAQYMDLYTIDRYFVPTPITENWSKLDDLIKYLDSLGCHITLVINTDIFDTYFQPDEPTAKKMEISLPSAANLWLDYCSKLMDRYNYAVDSYQALIDVNLTAGLTKERLYEFVDILKVQQVKLDPETEVWLGNVRGFDMEYLVDISNTPIWQLIDGVGFALYPFYDGIEEPSRITSPISHYIGDANIAAQLVKSKGKKINISGIGFSTIQSQSYGQINQASAIARSFFLLQKQGIENIYLSYLIDKAEWSSYPGNHLGILAYNGQPKASFYAIQRLINSLKGAQLSDLLASNISISPSKTVAIDKTYFVVYKKPNNKIDIWYWTSAVHPEPMTTSMWIYLNGYIPYATAGLLDEYANTPQYKYTPNAVLMVEMPLTNIPTQVSVEARGY